MTAMDFTAEDIAELRRQGDLVAFIREMTGARPELPTATARPAPGEAPRTDRPGAWPAGTSRQGPRRTFTPEEVQAAVEEYRHWDSSGRPAGTYRCDCGCTPNRHAWEA